MNACGIIEQIRERETAFSVLEVAKLLNISSRCIYDHITEGRLPSMRIGSTVRLDPSQVADWLTARAA
jgi:excisionase family DNA binding protein